MIDKHTGAILIKDKHNLLLNATLTIDQFLQSDLSQNVIQKDVYNYQRFLLSPQEIGDSFFTMELIFSPLNKLEFVTLVLSENGKLSEWDDWSEDFEIRLKRKHDIILEEHFGKAKVKPLMDNYTINCYSFPWGNISSSYDPRSASSSIIVQYN